MSPPGSRWTEAWSRAASRGCRCLRDAGARADPRPWVTEGGGGGGNWGEEGRCRPAGESHPGEGTAGAGKAAVSAGPSAPHPLFPSPPSPARIPSYTFLSPIVPPPAPPGPTPPPPGAHTRPRCQPGPRFPAGRCPATPSRPRQHRPGQSGVGGCGRGGEREGGEEQSRKGKRRPGGEEARLLGGVRCSRKSRYLGRESRYPRLARQLAAGPFVLGDSEREEDVEGGRAEQAGQRLRGSAPRLPPARPAPRSSPLRSLFPLRAAGAAPIASAAAELRQPEPSGCPGRGLTAPCPDLRCRVHPCPVGSGLRSPFALPSVSRRSRRGHGVSYGRAPKLSFCTRSCTDGVTLLLRGDCPGLLCNSFSLHGAFSPGEAQARRNKPL